MTKPHPNGEGLYRAIIDVLRQSKITPLQIDLVNAHAAGTIQGDEIEIKTLEKLFGDERLDNKDFLYSHQPDMEASLIADEKAINKLRLNKIHVISNKGHLGHTIGAAGAIESILSILSINQGKIPPTANLKEPIKTDLQLVRDKPIKKQIKTVLKESIAFGGTNACILYKKCEN